jgi:hypothetical protein
MAVITEGDGRTLPGHFDPEVLDAFRISQERFRDIFDAHADGGDGWPDAPDGGVPGGEDLLLPGTGGS